MLSNALQYVHEVIVRIDVVQPTCRQQALHNSDVFGAQLGPAEQPVLFTHRNDPQSTLEVVCVDRHLRVIQVDRQAHPALTDIPQRAKEGAARQESLFVELRVDPGKETFQGRFRLFLSARELGLARQPIVADLLLDLLKGGDRVQCLVGLRRLDIPGIKDLAACVCPALRVRDPGLLRVMRIGAVSVAL